MEGVRYSHHATQLLTVEKLGLICWSLKLGLILLTQNLRIMGLIGWYLCTGHLAWGEEYYPHLSGLKDVAQWTLLNVLLTFLFSNQIFVHPENHQSLRMQRDFQK